MALIPSLILPDSNDRRILAAALRHNRSFLSALRARKLTEAPTRAAHGGAWSVREMAAYTGLSKSTVQRLWAAHRLRESEISDYFADAVTCWTHSRSIVLVGSIPIV